MGNPGFARFEVQGIQIQVYRFCDLSYNLGQNKMEAARLAHPTLLISDPMLNRIPRLMINTGSLF